MKRISIFSLTGFYLLLTTGLFACILNCSVGLVLRDNRTFESQITEQTSIDEGMPCHQEEDHSCCKEQSSFVIKENINPDLQAKVPANLYAMRMIYYTDHSLDQVHAYSTSEWPENHPPPPKDHIPIYLKVRSLII